MDSKKIKDFTVKVIICILGNVIMALGVAVMKPAGFGNDPFNGSCMAVSAFFSWNYVLYTQCYNLFLFVWEIIFGRKYINIGTFINWILPSFVVSATLPLLTRLLGSADTLNLATRITMLAVGTLFASLGLAIYQQANAGIAPYDVIPIMIIDRFPKVKFFWVRIALDSASTLIIIIFGGIVGVGTIISALCLGPIVHFFTLIIKKLFPSLGR